VRRVSEAEVEVAVWRWLECRLRFRVDVLEWQMVSTRRIIRQMEGVRSR